jgi:hypothetical protein
MKIGMAILAYNITRHVWHEKRAGGRMMRHRAEDRPGVESKVVIASQRRRSAEDPPSSRP